jgi:nuclear GTP-binding protein
MSKMILNDWIRGRIPYFRMPPMPNNSKEEPENPIEVKQLYNKIFVTSAFSKDDLKASQEEETNLPAPDLESDSKDLSDAQNDEKEDDWDSVFQNVVEPSATEEEPTIESEVDSELEFSEQESIASVSSLEVQKKAPRMTTNKKKVGVHYYETANVKNKNRNKKRLLNPNEVAKRLKKK